MRQQAMTEQPVDDAKEVRVERRLVENVAADPVAAGNPPRPLVVPVGVAEQDVEERRSSNLPDVQEAEDECQQEHADGADGKRPVDSGRR